MRWSGTNVQLLVRREPLRYNLSGDVGAVKAATNAAAAARRVGELISVTFCRDHTLREVERVLQVNGAPH